MDFASKLATRAKLMELEAVGRILKAAGDPSIISLAGGLPANEVFPIEVIGELSVKVLRDHKFTALQYGRAIGFTPLREALAEYMTQRGIPARPENIIVTSGSQQVTDLLGKILLEPGDVVAVENPTFLGALQAMNGYQVEYLPIPCDENGPILDALDELLRRNSVKLVYLIPTFQNPSGGVISLDRRKRLAEITAQHEVLVLEDDPYGRLRYRGEELPAIKAMDELGNVMYTSTFSKLLAPGMRVGWLVADEQIIRPMISAKEASDVHTSTFCQAIAYEFLSGGHLERHLPTIVAEYGKKLDIMDDEMRRSFPAGARWHKPEGGMFLWVTLPEGANTSEIYWKGIEQGVAFVPGDCFYVAEGGENALRLNFSYPSPENIVEGVKRLGAVLNDALGG